MTISDRFDANSLEKRRLSSCFCHRFIWYMSLFLKSQNTLFEAPISRFYRFSLVKQGVLLLERVIAGLHTGALLCK